MRKKQVAGEGPADLESSGRRRGCRGLFRLRRDCVSCREMSRSANRGFVKSRS
jgi:hypothetical protein